MLGRSSVFGQGSRISLGGPIWKGMSIATWQGSTADDCGVSSMYPIRSVLAGFTTTQAHSMRFSLFSLFSQALPPTRPLHHARCPRPHGAISSSSVTVHSRLAGTSRGTSKFCIRNLDEVPRSVNAFILCPRPSNLLPVLRGTPPATALGQGRRAGSRCRDASA